MSNENEKLQPSEAQEAASETTAEVTEKKTPKKAPPKAPAKKAAPKVTSAEAPAEHEKPAAEKTAAPAVKAEPPVKKEEAPPPPPEPGRYGQLLIANGFSPSPLGNDATGMEMMTVDASELLAACRFLRESSASQFDLLVSIAGVDWKDRLEAVYHLYSTYTYDKVALKATAVDEKLPSVSSVWKTADWHERETYDLFGIIFEGHPKLERILMPSDWIGYPMRKDYTVNDPRLVWNER